MRRLEDRIRSRVRTANKRARRHGSTDKLTVEEVMERWRNTVFCSICKRYIEESDLSLDHLRPLSNDGLNHIDNVVIVHSWCNNFKDSKDFGDAQDHFSRIYPTAETGSVLIDSGAAYLLQPWAAETVKRADLPEDFGELSHLEQVRFVFDLSRTVEIERAAVKKHGVRSQTKNSDT